ncbi:hypothetical protein [Mesorhizobium sp. ORS 3428]|uniref:hypothetical protein n=1 Tax=Mesorhizobium sp. ORS 3428 TaxID=540997 RepID=UPI001041F7A4|nr:hypothetical protein [Mesorhizobium sp. ORS 3428]
MALSVWSLIKTCLIDAAGPAGENGPESRRFDVLDIGANSGFSKVYGHFAGLAAGSFRGLGALARQVGWMLMHVAQNCAAVLGERHASKQRRVVFSATRL